jgi:hypothetical protein
MPEPGPSLELIPLGVELAVARLGPDSAIPRWIVGSAFLALVRTADELSIVCESRLVPPSARAEGPFVALKVRGPLDFALTGVLAALAVPLAEEGVPVFAVSTFDTDYLLVRADDRPRAVAALERAGHRVTPG